MKNNESGTGPLVTRCIASGTQASHAFATPIHFSNSPPRSRGALLRPGFSSFASLTPIEGWAERRETFGCLRDTRWARPIASKTRVNALMTQRARRLRGALRPMTRDARLSALHRGGFGLPGPRFSHRRRLTLALRPASGSVTASSSHPGRSAWRATSLPPEANGYEPPPQDATPAPPSGCLRTTPLKERGCESFTPDALRSQVANTDCSQLSDHCPSRAT